MILHSAFSWIYWNPSSEAFSVPLLNYPILWYGIFFALSFILGYFLVMRILCRRYPFDSSCFLADRLSWFVVLGTVIGARLGAVFFYDWPYFKNHPLEIFQVWKGGLASHGGVCGILAALFAYTLYIRRRGFSLSFLEMIDVVAIPSALAGAFIRIGNFMNQEILGTPSTLPWAVLFGRPADGSAAVPRHPVQLYESVAYLGIFFLLYYIWSRYEKKLRPGQLTGLLFVLVFSARFILEFWKATQESILSASFLQMGQWLSLPFIFVGFLLIFNPLFFFSSLCSKEKAANRSFHNKKDG